MASPTADAAKLLPCPFCGGPATEMAGLVGCLTCACGRRDAASWNARQQPAPPKGELLSDAQIKHMVYRFLGWKLPKPWTPDNGISYVRPNYMHTPADHDWPTGTNLFTWSQAEAMVRCMIEGMPGLAARPKVEDADVASHVGHLHAEGVAWLTEKDGAAIADLLERLSVERDGLVNRALLILDAKNEWHDRAMAAEADLRTKETQLAQADAFINDHFSGHMHQSHLRG